MKKIIILVFTLLSLAFCQAQKVKLELNLVKGETYTQKQVTNLVISQTVNEQQVSTNVLIDCDFSYKVVDAHDSIFEMEVQYVRLAMKMGLPTGTVEFNSEKTDEKDLFSTIMGTLKNKAFNLKMTKRGIVTEIKNIEALYSGMFEKFPQLSEAQKQQLQSQIMQSFGDKAFKNSLNMVFSFFPVAMVTKGDKWIIKTQGESVMTLNTEATYELAAVNTDYLLILGSAKIGTPCTLR